MKTISILIFALFLCSCNTTKHIEKTKTETKTETEVNTVTTKTIVETAKEDIIIKSDSLVAEKDLDNDSIVEENENIKLIVTKDKKTGKIKAKAIQKQKIVPVEIKRTIVENSTKKEKTKTHTVAKVKTKDVERTGGFNFNYLWWLLLLLLIPIYKYRKFLFGIK